MKRHERVVLDDLFTDPVAGPDALLANGMRMPPGLVVSHTYLLDDAPSGKEWFVDFFPETQDENVVRQRARRCVQSILAASEGYVLRTTSGVLALPAHDGDRPTLLLFSQQAQARTFCERAGFECTIEPISLDEIVSEFLPKHCPSYLNSNAVSPRHKTAPIPPTEPYPLRAYPCGGPRRRGQQ